MDTQFKMTVSETTYENGSENWARDIKTKGELLNQAAERFWNSKAYFPAILSVAAVFLFTGLDVTGMIAMFAFTMFFHLFCEDLMAGVLPEVLFLLLGTKYYDKLSTLLVLWWMIPLLLASYTYNLVHWRKQLKRGGCFKSLIAVSVATLVGGIGVISTKDYFSFNTLLYAGGLGVCMLVASVIYGTSLSRPRAYNLCKRFCGLLYTVGIFAGLVVINYYLTHLAELAETRSVLYMSFRNYLTTMLLMSLPMPFRYMKDSRWHVAAVVFMYATLLLGGSRSGLVFGTLIVSACIYINMRNGKKLSRRDRTMIIPYLIAAGVIIFALGQTVLSSRLVDGQLFPITDSRVQFFKQAFVDFASNPITGIGIGNMQNSKIFLGVEGSMVWYHNYIAQIVGSMGLIGIFAYGWLLRDRFVLLKRLFSRGETMLVMAYAGMLLVSMTNPGEFCPFPNEFLMILLFDVAATLETAKAESTVTGNVISLSWTPARRTVPMGVYTGLSNTVSLSQGSRAVVMLRNNTNGGLERDGIHASENNR